MICTLLMTVLFGALSENETGWSDEVVVRQGPEPVVIIQARVLDNYLIVRLKHEAGLPKYYRAFKGVEFAPKKGSTLGNDPYTK